MTEHYFPLKIPINSNTTMSFSPRSNPGVQQVPAKWRHSSASCSYVWRHIFLISIAVDLLWMVIYIYEFSLQLIKAMRFNSTFPQTFWSPLVHAYYLEACYHVSFLWWWSTWLCWSYILQVFIQLSGRGQGKGNSKMGSAGKTVHACPYQKV